MRYTKKIAAIGFAAVLALTACAPDEGGSGEATENGWPSSIQFALSSAEGQESALENYGALISALEEDLGISVELVVATQAAGLIESAIAGGPDIVQLGPLGGAMILDRGGSFEVIGVTSGTPEMPQNASVGYALAETGINGFADLAGQDVCFGDPGSTTGTLYPSAAMATAGVDPSRDINAIFAGGHDQVADAVLAGDCIAGFSFQRFVEEAMPEEGVWEIDDINIFWKQEVESGGVMISTELPDSLFEAIKESLIDNNGDVLAERGFCPDHLLRPEGPTGNAWCALGPNTWGFYPVEPDYFDPVLEVCRITNAPACDAG